jgi:hypothetical protein
MHDDDGLEDEQQEELDPQAAIREIEEMLAASGFHPATITCHMRRSSGTLLLLCVTST